MRPDAHKASVSSERTLREPSKQGIAIQCGANSITQTIGEKPSSSPDQNPAPINPVWIALVSGASAVFGALVVALASYFTARKTAESGFRVETTKLRATLISAERLRWLQDIRQRLSTLYQLMDMQYNHLKRPVAAGMHAEAQLDGMSGEIMQQINVISLMLNPAKTDQAILRDALQEAIGYMRPLFSQVLTSREFNDPLYAQIKQKAFDALTRIGVQTWRKVKTLEQPTEPSE